MNNSRVVVITGGTRGIGKGIAEAFLRQHCNVVICGRTRKSVDTACAELATRSGLPQITGTTCDTSVFKEVQSLWDFAAARFGHVDIWINNAGIGQPQLSLWELDQSLIGSLADTNYRGVLFGCKVAAAGMLRQESGGAIYNMEGMGSNGMKIRGMTLYGSSKRALSYITDSLAMELKGTRVIVGSLQPGMVATEMLTSQYKNKPEEWKKVERVFNILADRVGNVAPWLVKRILTNKRNGARIKYFSSLKAFWRFGTSPFITRKVFDTTEVIG